MKLKVICSVTYAILFFSISTTLYAAPTRVTDLRVINVGPGNVTLVWTTPTPGAGLQLMENDVRYSLTSITAVNWASRTAVTGEPIPTTPGALQTAFVAGLNSNTTYYFGLKVRDGATGWSLVSNVVNVNTGAATKSATLTWVPPVPATGLRGYRVCQSKVSGLYSQANCRDVGNVTTYVLSGLVWGTPDFFVATAYYDNTELQLTTPSSCFDNPNVANWMESCYSNETRKD